MFSKCENLTELNKRRAELINEGKIPLIEINNSYNIKRTELVSKTKEKSKLEKFIPIIKTFPEVYTIPLIKGNNPNVIQLTNKGFVI